MGRGAYNTPIYSRTWFKQPPFEMFAVPRVSYSYGPKLPSTLLASVSIFAKTRLACYVAMFSIANNGKGVSIFDLGVGPRVTIKIEASS
jgi:hypothetical protein